MMVRKISAILVKLGQLRCLKQIREAIALLSLCSVAPLTGIFIPVGGHASLMKKLVFD